MTEKDLQKAVIECAHLFHWRVAHFRTAMGRKGNYMTPVAADGAGFPDLCMVRPPRLIFAELKVGYNKLSDAQKEWLGQFQEIGEYVDDGDFPAIRGSAYRPSVEVYIWRDKDWMAGTIEEILR